VSGSGAGDAIAVGVAFANAGPFADPEQAAGVVQAAEAAGIESLWTVEHVLVPVGYESTYPYSKSGKMPGGETFDIPDPLIWLAWVAASTSRIKLATGILILPQRNPAIVAKEVATLDRLSRGRAILGVGAGWLAEEFAALDVPFERRGARLEAYIETLRALWTQDEATVHDEFTDFDRCVSLPKPVQRTVPIVIGGHTDVAARRAGRLGDGFFPGRGSPERLAELLQVVRRTAEEAGRDPDAIEITVSGHELLGDEPAAAAERLHALGVDRVIVPPLAFDAASAEEAYGRFAEQVLPALAR
jgi:probable F420-dependent oxidoreductase